MSKIMLISMLMVLFMGVAMAEENNTTGVVAVEEVVEQVEVTEEAAPAEEEAAAANVTIAAVNASADDVVLTNNAAEAVNVLNWTLVIDMNETAVAVLPDISIEPAMNVTVSLGMGESAENMVFLNTTLVLNEMGGNVTLKDAAGEEVSYFEYSA
ncbi:MAG: hypothetical protein A4E45_00887 [Methanosaeta sp. PtaB.Bin039]|nr:MAG: hypothetical protein A4E45_00887 [Methanosaeta sp. PtaB.Bin039]HOT07623.1 hypothetical protein [Methanotrichaceae archaeon]HQF15671.1 hypothetical protein [Methanotrichaceae archaeon]HQI90407.1 hypothetical protein [Methanotrichaceae archaeon]HQJ28987.1 hypothetical protein [Methanotrichaceae archaeon]